MDNKKLEKKMLVALFDAYAKAQNDEFVMKHFVKSHGFGNQMSEAIKNVGLLDCEGKGRAGKWKWIHSGYPTEQMAKTLLKEYLRLNKETVKKYYPKSEPKPSGIQVTEKQILALVRRNIGSQMVAIEELKDAVEDHEYRKLMGAFSIVLEYYGFDAKTKGVANG